MKRSFLLVLVAVALAGVTANTAISQEVKTEFSKPVLIGGDNPASAASAAAAVVEFFGHPVREEARNFKVERDAIELEGFTVSIDDVFATPGAATGKAVSATSPIMDNPGARVASPILQPVNPLGPNDMSFETATGLKLSWGPDYALADGENIESRRIVLGDVRVEEAGEFKALFGKDPLESLIIGGSQAALVGNASAITPYDTAYPATVVAKQESFQWCSIPRFKMPWLGHTPCLMPLGSNEYKDVLMYDAVDLGNGIVGAAFDPFIVRNNMEWYLHVSGISTPPGYVSMTVPPVHPGVRSIVYHSPLVLFRKVGDETAGRYKFSGYSSFQFPKIKPGKTLGEMLWPFILTNWMLPLASNPIAIEAIDSDGGSGRPDSDLAVLYRNVLLDLDATVHGFRSRPAVFETANSSTQGYKTFRDMLGVCADDACSSVVSGITDELFPDSAFALMVVWTQANSWLESAESGDYKNMNPSHVFQPQVTSAIVGANAYDMAVLTDFADDTEGLRKQRVLVPSAYDAVGSDAVLYVVDENSRRIGTQPIKRVDPLYFDPDLPSCGYIDFIPARRTPLLLPNIVKVPRPADGLVPYRIESGYITDDPCADFIITWRGGKTYSDPENAGHVKFDDGSGRMFSNTITLGLRRESTPGTCSTYNEIEYRTIDVPSTAEELPQIAAAAIGRFLPDSEGGYSGSALKADILAGNAAPESNGNGAYTSYAYLFKAAHDYSTLPQDMERFRTGFATFEEKKLAAGVASISANSSGEGTHALAQVTGRPLMLPDVGCPDYSGSDDPTVASVFQTYRSIYANLWSAYWTVVRPDMYNVAVPFRDEAFHPLPVGCAEPEPCVVSDGMGGEFRLPFYKDDPCCKNPCSVSMDFDAWSDTQCGEFVLNHYGAFSCDVLGYAKAWHACPTAQAESGWGPLASEGDDRGGGGRDTDFASLSRRDVVVGHDYGAIAFASELMPAQHSTETIRQTPGIASQTQGDKVMKSGEVSPVSFKDLVKGLIAEGFPGNEQAQGAVDEIFQDAQIKAVFDDYQELINMRKAPDGLFGPPLSFEEIFLIPIYQSALLSEKRETAPEYGGKPGGFRSLLGGGCSIVPQAERDKGPEGIGARAGSVLKRIYDLLVPDAGAMDCADSANYCKVCNTMGDICWPPVGSQHDETCWRPACGDGCIIPPEQCDHNVNMAWEPTVQNFGCPPGEYCSNCQCVATTPATIAAGILANLKLPKGEIMPGHREMTALIRVPVKKAVDDSPPDIIFEDGLRNNDCMVQCASFSSEASALRYKQSNDEIRAITGRADDFICPPEQGVTVLCRVDSASAPGLPPSDISLSLAGSPLADIPGNVLPYSLIQTGGSVFNDETKLTYRTFQDVADPLRLIPIEGQGVSVQAQTVPQLASAIGAVPMTATSVSGSPAGTLLINNMYSHRVLSSGTEVSLQLADSQTSQVPGTAVTIHENKFRTVNTGASWVGVEGAMPGLKPIEERIDWEQMKVMMKERAAQAGPSPSSAIYVDPNYPVVPNQRYSFVLYQDTYAPKGELTGTAEVQFGFIVGEPSAMVGVGSGCGCFVTGSEPAASSVIPALLAVLLPAAGIAVMRLRRRR